MPLENSFHLDSTKPLFFSIHSFAIFFCAGDIFPVQARISPSSIATDMDALDVETLTPIEALNFLYELKKKLE